MNQPNQPAQPLQPAAQPPAEKKSVQKRPSRRPLLKPKQALFVQFYTDRKSETFGNALRSALKAGYKQEYAEKILGVLSENVASTMTQALDEAGLTDEVLADKHAELLQKREVVFIRDGKGSHHELTEQPDTNAVKAALDMAYKLKRHYPAERMEHTGANGGPLIIERAPTDGKPRSKNQAQAASG
jgi:phage terminase small subunit